MSEPEGNTTCPACGARWPSADQDCQAAFYQMLAWENEDPGNGVVHHLMVLVYHLQHPHLYSPEGLAHAKGLLVDFLERGQSPQQVRRMNRDRVDSGRRGWKITARPGSAGAYAHPLRWTVTARDVVAGGIEQYVDNVRRWAEAALRDLKEAGNL
jgi:hypothetical protein